MRDPYDSHPTTNNSYPTGPASFDAWEAMAEYRTGTIKNWDWDTNGYPTEEAIDNTYTRGLGVNTGPND